MYIFSNLIFGVYVLGICIVSMYHFCVFCICIKYMYDCINYSTVACLVGYACLVVYACLVDGNFLNYTRGIACLTAKLV